MLREHTTLHRVQLLVFFFFFNDTATTEIYTLSLHDALPISRMIRFFPRLQTAHWPLGVLADRKSTRLNSSHGSISYAVFCLKKKKQYTRSTTTTCIAATSHATSRLTVMS